VDALIEDVNAFLACTILEKFALPPVILEIVSDPCGFRMAVELNTIEDRRVASIVLYTIRLLVVTAFDAVIFCVLTPGTAIPSEKRRLLPR
jgi:hypothetical protein